MLVEDNKNILDQFNDTHIKTDVNPEILKNSERHNF